MKYFLIAGEASGDLHASNLMRALKQKDPEADFRYYGGNKMAAEGGVLLRHYSEIAYMGFIPVLLHLRTILGAMRQCREAIIDYHPDVLILIDYPGFNLKIANYIKKHTDIPVYYYIAPKIWAWKEHRIKAIRRDVDELFSILPFEVPFFEQKHHYPIHYVGNPSVDEIAHWQQHSQASNLSDKPIIALLPGSRRQEIKDNLKRMLCASNHCVAQGYQLIIAAAPGIDDSFYHSIITSLHSDMTQHVSLVRNSTFQLLSQAQAALVTSGTATLETALLHTPQVVCYYIAAGPLFALLRKLFLKIPYISLVNLIVNRELVPELVGSQMNVPTLTHHLNSILPGGKARQQQLDGYRELDRIIGQPGAPLRAATIMLEKLSSKP